MGRQGPNCGFQLALRVRLASRFPIQVEERDPARAPKKGHGFRKSHAAAQNNCKTHATKMRFSIGAGPSYPLFKEKKVLGARSAPNLNWGPRWEGKFQHQLSKSTPPHSQAKPGAMGDVSSRFSSISNHRCTNEQPRSKCARAGAQTRCSQHCL